MRTCGECGGTNHMFKPHKKTCSQYKHYVDDHYDSACMRGTCQECNPEYQPPVHMTLTAKEAEELKLALEFHLEFCMHGRDTEYLLKNIVKQLKV